MPVLGMRSEVSIAQVIRAGEIAGVGQPRRIAAGVLATVEQVAEVAQALSFDSKPLRAVIDQIQKHAHNLRPPRGRPAKHVKKKIAAKPGGKAPKRDPVPALSA
jgi:hypothetical protein